jgi:hypothetical protein
MAVVNWGALLKSQVDSEKIEDAINRLIASHNGDETAHLGVGQSLQSHKASEIIDHLAQSIIQDKLAPHSVNPTQFDIDRYYIQLGFEVLTNYLHFSASGGAVEIKGPGVLYIKPGTALNSLSLLGVQNLVLANNINRFPFFQAIIFKEYPWNSDIRIISGVVDVYNNMNDSFGIEYVKSSDLLRGFVAYDDGGGLQYLYLNFTATPAYRHLLRAEVDSDNELVLFYCDNVLQGSIDYSGHTVSISDANHIALGVRRAAEAAGNSGCYFTNVIFSVKLTD